MYLLDSRAENDQQFADRALDCTGVDIFELTELPFLVCLNCQAQIDQFYKYRKKIVDNREVLLAFIVEYKERKKQQEAEEAAVKAQAKAAAEAQAIAEAEAQAKAAAEAEAQAQAQAILKMQIKLENNASTSQVSQPIPDPTEMVIIQCPDFKLFENYAAPDIKPVIIKKEGSSATTTKDKEPKSLPVVAGYETYQKDLASCEICLEVYSNYDNYLQHLKSPKHEANWEQNWRLRPDFTHVLGPNYFAQKANFYKCCICLRNIKRADHYERHISTDEHRVKLEKLRLIHPDKRLDDSRYYNYNLGQVVKIGETKSSNRIYNRKYVCQFCERSFVNSSHLNYHMGSQHESFLPKTMFCEKCNNGFVNQAHYKYHMKRNCPFREGANNQTI